MIIRASLVTPIPGCDSPTRNSTCFPEEPGLPSGVRDHWGPPAQQPTGATFPEAGDEEVPPMECNSERQLQGAKVISDPMWQWRYETVRYRGMRSSAADWPRIHPSGPGHPREMEGRRRTYGRGQGERPGHGQASPEGAKGRSDQGAATNAWRHGQERPPPGAMGAASTRREAVAPDHGGTRSITKADNG